MIRSGCGGLLPWYDWKHYLGRWTRDQTGSSSSSSSSSLWIVSLNMCNWHFQIMSAMKDSGSSGKLVCLSAMGVRDSWWIIIIFIITSIDIIINIVIKLVRDWITITEWVNFCVIIVIFNKSPENHLITWWCRYQTRASHWILGPLTAYVIIPLFLKVAFQFKIFLLFTTIILLLLLMFLLWM